MQKLLSGLLLMLVSINSIAEPILVASDEIKTVYADPASLVQDRDWVSLSGLFDFKSIHTSNMNQTYQSLKFHDEYDCSKKLKRNISISIYSGKMGEGEMLIAYDDISKWQEVSGVSAKLWQLACEKYQSQQTEK